MRLAAALLLAAVAATPAAAQQPYRSDDRAPTAPQGYDRNPPSAYDRGSTSSRSDADDRGGSPAPGGREQGPDLRRELNLRADQRAAYDAYTGAFRPDEARERQAQEMEGRMAAMTTPQRLDYARQEMDRDRADFDRTDAATRRFYGVLSVEQRRTFDRLTAPQGDDGGDEDQDGGRTPADPARPR